MCFVTYPLACVFVDIEKMRRLDGVLLLALIGLYQGKDIVFRFILEYSSLRDFYRPLGNNNNNNRSTCFNMRIFERQYFGFVLKLEISYRAIISCRILVSFRGFFEGYIFAW
jgi:hypothetical protein